MKEEIIKIINEALKKYDNIGRALSNIFKSKQELYEWILKNSVGHTLQECLYNLYYGNNEIPKCKICKLKEVKFINFEKGYKDCCCFKCTNIFKYGVENPAQSKEIQKKIEKTMLKKYNGRGAGSQIIQEKRKNTIFKKYGKDYQKLDNYKNKVKQTNLMKYGAEHFMKTEEGIKKYLASRNYHEINYIEKLKNLIKDKQFKLSLGKRKNYFNNVFLPLIKDKFIPLFSFEEYKGITHTIKYPFKCCKCNSIFESSLKNLKRDNTLCCPTCKQSNKSVIQSLIKQELININSTIIIQEEKLNILSGKKLLDFYLPELKLAIEYNGNIWHAEKFNNKTKLYHYQRFQECLTKNIDYLAFWSDEYTKFKQYILKIFNYFLNKNKNNNTNLVFPLTIYKRKLIDKNIIFFTNQSINDQYLIIKSFDFLLIIKFTDTNILIINDVYCNNWFILDKYSNELFKEIKSFFNCKLFFNFDNRLLPIYKILFKNLNFLNESKLGFYKLTNKRTKKIYFNNTKENQKYDKIWSYGFSNFEEIVT